MLAVGPQRASFVHVPGLVHVAADRASQPDVQTLDGQRDERTVTTARPNIFGMLVAGRVRIAPSRSAPFDGSRSAGSEEGAVGPGAWLAALRIGSTPVPRAEDSVGRTQETAARLRRAAACIHSLGADRASCAQARGS